MLVSPLLLAGLVAQAPAPTPLPLPSAVLAEEFSGIISVRELADGRLLVADTRETRVVVVDFVTGRIELVGRTGDGPGEYRRVAPLRPLGGDSSLMISTLDRRWFIFDGPRITGTFPADHAMVVAGSAGPVMITSAMLTLPLQADARGSVLGFVGPSRMTVEARAPSPRDSLAVILISRLSGRIDTIAFVQQRPTRSTMLPAQRDIAGGMRYSNPPWAVGEQVVLMPDGWVAVVRLGPYRVDWRDLDGRWMRGTALPVQPIAVTARDREAWLAQLPATDPRPLDDDWPRTMPPVGHDGRFTALADLAGRVIVHRSASASDTTRRYDVVDRTGRIIRQVTMPRSHRLIGFGRGTAYVMVADEDGLQRIQRHPWQ